ncbi:DUF4430 domain-containing protein [Sutcliffiella rhizosphaerae]|uniref:Transcobalamin-like C-terminal domain-containing protein n=1 Tax=Sutcliffiella rhizosphaerae TaxID=2880967 RepID=A0ABM8YQT9_9BACI|nr:DUF4430 domain-containing protein [Sutcliffiella rhizosphaerae]CAG9622330.1 hypothetical protein BACCIP111883_03121 [Sutcliffiella rhizosphaerae]
MKKIFMTLFTVIILLIGGCAQTNNDTNNNATPSNEQTDNEQGQLTTSIKLSKEGDEVISENTVEFEDGESLMDAMEQNYDLTTGFGGDFIVGINGLGSEEESDHYWNIKVNGEDLMVGASDYVLEENDEVHFSYTKVE